MEPNRGMMKHLRKQQFVGTLQSESKVITVFGCTPKKTSLSQANYELELNQTTMELANQGVKGAVLIFQGFNQNGQQFNFLLLMRIHGKIVKLIQNARSSAQAMKRGLHFDDLFEALQERTFMNQFKSNLPTNDKGSSSGKQNTTYQSNGAPYQSNGTTNKSPKEGTNKIQTRISSNQQ
jgi:hypothetical protein